MLFDLLSETIKHKPTTLTRKPLLANLTMRACFECGPISIIETFVPAIRFTRINHAIALLAFVLASRFAVLGKAYGEPFAVIYPAHLKPLPSIAYKPASPQAHRTMRNWSRGWQGGPSLPRPQHCARDSHAAENLKLCRPVAAALKMVHVFG